MYIPKSFSETDLDTLQAFMQQHNFAAVVSQLEGELVATHLPLMLDKTRGQYGTLVGHLARANTQWKGFDEREALVIFQGPHTYITPNWYETTPSVPTWNYTVVHAYGTPRIVEEPAALSVMLESLVNHHEAGFSPSWKMELPEDYMDKMLKAIVGFELTITRLEGKFKLSQNKLETDHARVTEALTASDYPPDREVGALMRERQ